jgi:hypothetical protein
LTATRIILRCGDQTQTRTVAAGGSYLSANAPQLYFGLGFCDKPVQLEIRWPNGTRTDHHDLPTNEIHRITR